ncbi:MAG: glutathione S-transferase [Pseudomonadota bacterium]
MLPISEPPVLWSFRRCPYAMRARLALAVSETPVWLREVVLRDKPSAMLDASPKGTVPVLVLSDGTVIDQSRDIMLWALNRHDPERWLAGNLHSHIARIDENDARFKHHLDRYKYPDRYGLPDGLADRAKGFAILQTWDQQLAKTPFLNGEVFGLTDAALAPFVRQFANTDRAWFDQQALSHLQAWLADFLASDRFAAIMTKHAKWEAGPGHLSFSGLVFSEQPDHKAGP